MKCGETSAQLDRSCLGDLAMRHRQCDHCADDKVGYHNEFGEEITSAAHRNIHHLLFFLCGMQPTYRNCGVLQFFCKGVGGGALLIITSQTIITESILPEKEAWQAIYGFGWSSVQHWVRYIRGYIDDNFSACIFLPSISRIGDLHTLLTHNLYAVRNLPTKKSVHEIDWLGIALRV